MDWDCSSVSTFGRSKHDVCVPFDFTDDFERCLIIGLDSETYT
jgi:hypothetical protein